LFLQGDASCPLKDLFDHNLCFESGEWRAYMQKWRPRANA